MKSIAISFLIFVLLLGMLFLGGFVYVMEPGQEGRLARLQTAGRLLLYRHSLIEGLSNKEIKLLYQSSCTRRCHSKAVIEDKPRTAMEWEQIVERMGRKDRANLSFKEARTIIEYLQRNYLSNVPTLLPDHAMRFLKENLWRLDFGESDLYFDLIYMPRQHRRFLPYLALKARPTEEDSAQFIVYVNTHSGVIPDWDMGEITILEDDRGRKERAMSWQVLYEDIDKHHRQGILTFPPVDEEAKSLQLIIRPKGMRERAYGWKLPAPDYHEPPPENAAKTKNKD